ncbi:MAG: DUF2141 domain-containing protein [Dechloromonas sp.]|nr:DUF2141 domain-containing protein [Dechloromonas sp.]
MPLSIRINRPRRRDSLPRLPIQPLLLACMLAGQTPAQAAAGQLHILVEGIQGAPGQLRASLYREPDSFRKEARALQTITLPARPDRAELAFDGLNDGRYAVMVYHDTNDNQALDLRFGMFPTEGYGLSNNPQVMGPPKFEDSAFELKGPETRIQIRLAY